MRGSAGFRLTSGGVVQRKRGCKLGEVCACEVMTVCAYAHTVFNAYDYTIMMVNLEQLQFASEYVLNGGNATKALITVKPHISLEDARGYAAQYLSEPRVQQLINEKRKTLLGPRVHQVFTQTALTAEEKRSFLAAVVRATPSELDEDSPLVEEVRRGENGTTFKTVSKAKAIMLDNAMAGHNAPVKAEISGELDFDSLLERVTGQKVIEAELVSHNPWD